MFKSYLFILMTITQKLCLVYIVLDFFFNYIQIICAENTNP
jgi:hypothetical protein